MEIAEDWLIVSASLLTDANLKSVWAKSLLIEKTEEHCILISGIDLIQDILCGPENIQGHLETY